MVKIKGKLFLIGLFTFILALSIVNAAGSKLIFSDVDVKVGSKTSNNLNDGDNIDDEAEPGDIIELRIEVKNNYTSSEDIEIEDITIEATIDEFDSGDESTEESTDFNLKATRDKRVTLKFTVPDDIDEDSFDIEITADGDDENGTGHSASMTLRLDVEKENHLLRITRASLLPSTVSCGKRNIQLPFTVINAGSNDEDDVSIRIFNSELGINIQEDAPELTEDSEDDENEFSNTYTFTIPSDTEEGPYPITVRALFDNDRRKAEEILTLTVNRCATSSNTGNTGTNTGNNGNTGTSNGGVSVITPQPTTNTNTPTQTEEELPPGTVITTEGAVSSNAFIIGIIAAEVVAVLVGIVLLVALFRKK